MERFAFARAVAPASLGICGDNPPLLRPTEDSLPAEPIDKITAGPRETTAWYDPDPKLLSSYLAAMAEYHLNLPSQSELAMDATTWEAADWCLRKAAPRWLIGFRNIARSNDERTALFSVLPKVAVGHSMPLVSPRTVRPCDVPLLLGMFDALVFDFFVRQKLGGVNMTFGYVMQFPALPPEKYDASARAFIIPRVLELVCNSWDLKPFLNDVWGSGDNSLREAITRQWQENRDATGDHVSAPPIWYQAESQGFPHPPFRWSEGRRSTIRAELDACYARLYGLTEQELRYILDPGSIHGDGFPSESFRVLKEKEIAEFGEYRTAKMVLEAWRRIV